MSCGLAEYLATGSCPTPAIVQEWEQIPDSLVQSFTSPGFCVGDCFSAGQGLGDVAMSAPGGYFSTMDFSQWGVEEWATVALGVYLLSSLWQDTKTVSKRIRRTYKKASR